MLFVEWDGWWRALAMGSAEDGRYVLGKMQRLPPG